MSIPPKSYSTSQLLNGQRLSVHWQVKAFDELVDDANDEILCCFTQAYIMRLIGRYLILDRIDHRVPLMYLSLLEDFERVG